MLKYFKKDAKLILNPWLLAIPFIICTVTDIIVLIIQAFFVKPFEEFFMPGVFVGIIFSTLFIPVYSAIYSNFYMDLAVSMGRKRKSFLFNSLSLSLIFSIAESILLCALSCLYPAVHFIFFKSRPTAEDFFGFINFNTFIKFAPIFLLIAVCSVIFGIIYSAVIRKYGSAYASFIWVGFWLFPICSNHIHRFLSSHDISNALIIVSTSIPVVIFLAAAAVSFVYLSKSDIKI